MKFSQTELRDLFIAWIIISAAFAILFSGGNFFQGFFIIALGISALTVGISFLFHELMHKYMSQKYGLWAEFRAYYPGLFLALVFSFFGFIFAAPGAVVSRSHRPLSREIRGKISLAGPLTNIALALLFLPGFFLIKEGILGLFFSYGLSINGLLAAFNLIPVKPFDGADVYSWNKAIYLISTALAVVLFVVSFII
jgi:Zn-dependent protease